MKTKSRRKVREEEEPSAADSQEAARRSEEAALAGEIDLALRRVGEALWEAHRHDAEIARLGEETRRLIAEMQRDLNLRAA